MGRDTLIPARLNSPGQEDITEYIKRRFDDMVWEQFNKDIALAEMTERAAREELNRRFWHELREGIKRSPAPWHIDNPGEPNEH